MKVTTFFVVLSLFSVGAFGQFFSFQVSPAPTSIYLQQAVTYTIRAQTGWLNVQLNFTDDEFYTVRPLLVDFSSGVAQVITITALQATVVDIIPDILGADGTFYFELDIQVTLSPRGLVTVGGYANFPLIGNSIVGVETDSFLLALNVYPNPTDGVTVTVAADPADALTFGGQTSFDFTDVETSYVWSYTIIVPQKPVTIYWTFTGASADLYEQGNNTVTANLRSVTPSPNIESQFPTVGSSSQTFTLSVDYATAAGNTITPFAPDLTFSPPSVVLSATSPSATFSYVASEPGAQVISWSISGDNSDWFALPQNITIAIPARQFTVVFPAPQTSYAIGSFLTYTVWTQYPPDTDVSLTLTVTANCPAPGTSVSLSTDTLSFTGATTSQSFTVTSQTACSDVIITAVTGGDEADLYIAPGFGGQIAFGKFSVSIKPVDPTFHPAADHVLCGDSLDLVISVSSPPPTGFTVDLSSPGTTFSVNPPSFAFTPTAISFTFTVTASWLAINDDIVLHSTVTGTDSILVQNIGDFGILSGAKSVNYVDGTSFKSPGANSLLANSPSKPIKITLLQLPANDLSVTLQASGLTFNPTPVAFTNQDTSSLVSVSGASVGSYTVSITLGGTDALCYVLSNTATTITVAEYAIDVEPAPASPVVGVPSQLYTISIDNLPAGLTVTVTPQVYDVNNNPVTGVYTFDPSSFVFTAATPSYTFTYTVNSARVGDRIVFTSDQTSIVANFDFFAAVATLREFNMPSINVNTIAIVGIPTPSFVVTLDFDQLPPTGVTLTPTAVNAVFNPLSLSFSNSVNAQSFTITTSVGAAVPGDTIDGVPIDITWTVGGTDQALYDFPTPQTLISNLRPLSVSGVPSPSVVNVNEALTFTITTPYPPAAGADITVTPSGTNLVFGPLSAPFGGLSSQVFTVQPQEVGSFPVTFTVSGADADLYLVPAGFAISAVANSFTVSQAAITLDGVIGSQSYVVNIRVNQVPQDSVTLSLFSQQVTANPPSVTFSSDLVEQNVYLTLVYSGVVPIGTIADVDVQFVVSGPDAQLYTTPSDVTFQATTSQALRELSFSNTNLWIGRNTTFTVSAPIPPSTSLTITPTIVADEGYWISPPSATFTPTTTGAVFTVGSTLNSLPAISPVSIYLSVSGPDAWLYANNGVLQLSVQSGAITAGFGGANYYVNSPSQLEIQLTNNPVPAGGNLVVTPYVLAGQPFKFDPPFATFNEGEATAIVTITPLGVGESILGLNVSGASAWAYTYFPALGPATIAPSPINFFFDYTLSGSSGGDLSITLVSPVVNGLTISFDGPGATFTPNPLVFNPGDVTQTFTVTPSQSNANAVVLTNLGGPDAAWYTNPCTPTRAPPCKIITTPGTVSLSTATSGSALQATLTIQISADTGDYSLTVTPSTSGSGSQKRQILDSGVTFVPSSVTFTGGSVLVQTIKVFSTTPGAFNIFATLSGDAAPFYELDNLDQYLNPTIVTFNEASISATGVPNVGIATLSQPVVLTVNSPSSVPLPPLIVTPYSVPDGLDFWPSSFVLNSTTASFSYNSSTPGTYTILFTLSGDGATTFAPIGGITAVIDSGAFSVPSLGQYVNLYMSPNPSGNTFVYGVSSQLFTVYVRSANNVSLTLSADGIDFEPSVLTFSSTQAQSQFRFTPRKVGPFVITYSVSGPDAAIFNVPTPTVGLFATYKLTVPIIPVQTVGTESAAIPLTIEPAPQSTLLVTIQLGAGSPGNSLVFSPSTLVFTPTQTTQSFTIVPTIVNLPRPSTGSVHIPGYSGISGGSAISIVFFGQDGADNDAPQIPISNALGVVVAPGYFILQHPRYQLDVASQITIDISHAPRSDVTVSLFSNNLALEPPYITFVYGGPTSQSVKVTPRQTTSYELDYASFKVDYALSGTNAVDYITPSETLHYFALPMGYIAAIVLVPLGVIIIAIIALIFLRKSA